MGDGKHLWGGHTQDVEGWVSQADTPAGLESSVVILLSCSGERGRPT